MRWIAVLVSSCLAAAPVFGIGDEAKTLNQQLALRGLQAAPSPVGPGCSGGSILDDGTFENGYVFTVPDSRFVQRFTVPASPAALEAVCVCWSRLGSDSTINFEIHVYDDNGAGGSPGTLLASYAASASGVPGGAGTAFYGYDLSPALSPVAGNVYIGVRWNDEVERDFFLCADESFATPRRTMYGSIDGGDFWVSLGGTSPIFSEARALGIRAELGSAETPDPDPPAGPWLASPGLPGFQAKVRITAGANTIAGAKVDDCIVDTLCVSGAVAGRPEVFIRVVGPRPNGFLWPTLVKFSTSTIEIWIQQLSSGEIQYYRLPGAAGPDDETLPGLFDRQGFRP
jgi:hypothetical protein